MRFESKHFWMFSISTSKHVATSSMFSPEACNVLVSAKSHISDFSIQNIRSCRNILISKLPRIESCGTLDETQYQSLKAVPIFIRYFLLDRELCNKFKLPVPKPYVASFANSKFCGK